jgi:hypothetical protein
VGELNEEAVHCVMRNGSNLLIFQVRRSVKVVAETKRFEQ